MITETARLVVRPDALPDLMAGFVALSPAFHCRPRCLGVELMQATDDPCSVLCVTRWRDRQAAHEAADSDEGASFIAMVRRHVTQPPALSFWSTPDLASGSNSGGT